MLFRKMILFTLLSLTFLFKISANETLLEIQHTSLYNSRGAPEFNQEILQEDSNGEPSSIINHAVSAISGNYFDSEVDMYVPGVTPLIAERHYCSNQELCKGWNYNNYGAVQFLKPCDMGDSFLLYAKVTNSEYSLPDCSMLVGLNNKLDKPFKCRFSILNQFNRGYSNTCKGPISGRTNDKNHIINGNKWNDSYVELIAGSGNKKYFKKISRTPDLITYLMTLQHLPNGNKIKYLNTNTYINEVQLTNKNETNVLASLKYDSCRKGTHFDTIVSTDGRKVVVKYGEFSKNLLVNEVERPNSPTITYQYDKKYNAKSPLLASKQFPHKRFLNIEYYTEGKNPLGFTDVPIKEAKDKRINRVKCLKEPLGTDETPITAYSFIYELKHNSKTKKISGYTDVIDALNHQTRYAFDEDSRLTSIQKFTGNKYKSNSVYTTENLVWGDNFTTTDKAIEELKKCAAGLFDNAFNLLARTLTDLNNVVQYSRAYTYDKKGNILKDTLFGNFSGHGKPVTLNPDLTPKDDGAECYIKEFNYSEDEFNLVVKEIDNKLVTQFRYKKGTDVPVARLIGDGNSVLKREFLEYDDNSTLIKKTIDDGSSWDSSNLAGVTERLITYTLPKASAPCVGLPEIIKECYLDLSTGQEVQLGKIVNTYTREGWITKQEHYDSNNELRFILEWEFDRFGNVICQTDAMGNKTYKKYDANNNLIEEISPLGYLKKHSYDFSNRIISTLETDGVTSLTTLYKYDYKGNCVSKIDIYGNETLNVYDEFGRIIETSLPEVNDDKGVSYRPKILKSYDVMSRVVSETDGRGFTITKKYNVLGKPYEINYPDGTTETFEYTYKGNCSKSVGKNGTYNLYFYDVFDRLIKQETYSANNELLTTISNTYSSFHMVSSTDASGCVTYYTYDGAGRKKSIKKEDTQTDYAYDSLGRLYKTLEWYGDKPFEVTVKVQEYDVLNNIIEERIENGNGEIFQRQGYLYDAEGNCIQKITYLNNEIGITTTAYNFLKQPVYLTDALGNETLFHYDYSKKGLEKITVDSKGNYSISLNDSLGRTVSVIRKNILNKEIAKKRAYFDASGNRTRVIDTAISILFPNRDISTAWEYDTAGRVTKLHEAYRSENQKITRYSYNKTGQKEIIYKNDGIELRHDYDALSHLSHFYGSDNSFDYSYTYDLNNNLIHVLSNTTNQETHRHYDKNNRLIEEDLANGFRIHYVYDKQGRPQVLTLPDDSKIIYRYDALFLREVERQSDSYNYSHHYLDYDLSGHLLRSQYAGDIGQMDKTYNLLGNEVSSKSPYFKENEIRYDSVGNLTDIQFDDTLDIITCRYQYDDLHQLSNEDGVNNHTYVHDSLNNRLEKDGMKYEINDLNQLTSNDEWTYFYDLNGNLIRKEKGSECVSFMYDSLDRLIEVYSAETRTFYTYDSFNRRLSKEEHAIDKIDPQNQWRLSHASTFMYVGQNEIGRVENGEFKELRILGSGKGAEIGASIAMEIDKKLYIPIHDHNGNVRQIIDAGTKEIKETYRFSAFGEETLLDEKGSEIQESINPWRYSSKRFDKETGFIYFGRRYYLPELGRWMTMDPLGYEAGPNPYAYVFNSPLFHFDLYGLEAVRASHWSHYPGYYLNHFNHHFNYIPGLRQSVNGVSRKMCGMTWEWDNNPPSGIYPRDYKPLKGGYSHTHVNGIYTPIECAYEHRKFLGACFGHTPQIFYNRDEGVIGGVVHDKFLSLIHTGRVKLLKCDTLLQMKRIRRGEIKEHVISCFSHGARVTYEATHDLPRSDKEYICIYSFGGSKLIPNDGFKHVQNIVNECDFVPKLGDPEGYLRGLRNDGINLKIVSGAGDYWGMGHYFEHPSYKKEMETIGKRYQAKYGSDYD